MKKLNSSLLNKTCISLQDKLLPLSQNAISKLLLEIGSGWIINKSNQLYKEYNFHNFIKTIEFINKIAALAEQEGHHPDLFITWGKCTVSIWTHDINGLTENDFILAAKIEAI